MAYRKLHTLERDLVRCTACPRLVGWREQVAEEKRASFADETYWGRPVPGFGDPDARLMVLGLAPAAHGANRTGRMFTGDRSGDFLFAALHRMGFANQPTSTAIDDGLTLADCWVTSPVKCAPPANQPTVAERKNCATWLHDEVKILNPRVVLALGGIGWNAALDHFGWTTSRKPKFAHAAAAALPDGRTLLGSFHVSQLNTFTGRLTEEMFDAVLARARDLLGHDLDEPPL